MPTMRVLRLTRLLAIWLGWKSSAFAACFTRSRTFSLMRGLSCNARLTVEGDTPAALATSLMVAFMPGSFLLYDGRGTPRANVCACIISCPRGLVNLMCGLHFPVQKPPAQARAAA